LVLTFSSLKLKKMENEKTDKLGDWAPELKHYVIVFGVVLVLVAFGWISWHWFGWFHSGVNKTL